MSQSLDVERFCAVVENSIDRTRKELNRFLVLFIMACVEEVVVGGEYGPGTPVDTGFLRAMWWLDINGAGSSPNLQRPTGPRRPGEPMLFPGDGVQVPLDLVAGDVIGLNNNAEYASYVELGTDRMAPRAMVRSVANASQAIAARVARDMGWNNQNGIQLGLGL